MRGVLSDESPIDTGSDELPLIPRHRALLACVEASRALTAARQNERKDKEARISGMRAELDGASAAPTATSIEPAIDAEGGLSLTLMGRLQTALDAVSAERATRVEKATALRVESEALRAELGYPAASETSEGERPQISLGEMASAEEGLAALRAEKSRRLTVLADCTDYICELQTKLDAPRASRHEPL